MTARNYFSRQNTIVQESVQWVPWPGPARKRGRGVSDGGRPPVGDRFRVRQPDRTPFFRLTPAFGLRSLRKNGYVLTGVDGTGPPTGDGCKVTNSPSGAGKIAGPPLPGRTSAGGGAAAAAARAASAGDAGRGGFGPPPPLAYGGYSAGQCAQSSWNGSSAKAAAAVLGPAYARPPPGATSWPGLKDSSVT